MATKEFDILLRDGESTDDVQLLLEKRYGVQVEWQDASHNSAETFLVTGTEDQLRRVAQWHNAPHNPRPDLQGKPPVAKGQRR